MISRFVDPHPDEIFYSVCARFSDRTQYRSQRSIVQEMFATGNAIATVGLPSHLGRLVGSLIPGHRYSVDQLIDEHTLLPFYAPFLPPARLAQLREQMRGDNGGAIHTRAGIMASRIPLPSFLRFCPCCAREDRQQFGEYYWHRLHQVPGVEVCPFHQVWLEAGEICIQRRQTRYVFVSAERAIQSTPERALLLSDTCHQILLQVARDACWLLNHQEPVLASEERRRRYLHLLARHGWATASGIVHQRELLQAFKAYYSPEGLHLLHCELDENTQDHWLARLVHTKEVAQHPLYHLLLIQLLGFTAETFFRLSPEYLPFGKGPWPCLNPVSAHYQQSMILECQITHNWKMAKRPVGTFACSCGFTYFRAGPDQLPEDRLRRDGVKAFGPLWEEALQKGWEDPTLSLRALAGHLGVDPLTVQRHANQLGLIFPRPGGRLGRLREGLQLRSPASHVPAPALIEAYRDEWLAAIQADPGAGIRVLRSRVARVYTWLYRHDRDWLEAHKPPRKRVSQPQIRIDWNSRDVQVAAAASAAALRLKNTSGPPVHLTTAAIGRESGCMALIQQHLEKLPLTAQALDGLVETREDYAIRRIQWAANQYQQEHYYPKRWQFIKRAGVDRLVTVPQVREAIDNCLAALQTISSSS